MGAAIDARWTTLAAVAGLLALPRVARDSAPPPRAVCDAHIAADGALVFAPRGASGTALRLETLAVARAGAPVAWAGRARVLPDARGATIDRGGGVLERIDVAAGGVEQSWRFAARPADAGDLVVRVGVAGAARARAGATGVVFEAGARPVARYGDAAWVDADGRRTPLRVAWSAETREIVLRVPSGVVDAARYPATLDPWLSDEFPLDAPADAPATTDYQPTVAFDGVNYLAVWGSSSASAPGVYAARFDVAGTVLDAPPVAVATGGTTYGLPTVAFGGGAYLVLWTAADGLRGARVGVDGSVLPGAGFLIASGDSSEGNQVLGPAVAHASAGFLVAYQRGVCVYYGGIEIVRVADDGTLLDAAPIALTPTTSPTRCQPVVASNGTGWLLAWDQLTAAEYQIYGTTVAADGTVAHPAGVSLVADTSTWAKSPAVGSDGTNYLVAWTIEVPPLSGSAFVARRFDADGAPLDATATMLGATSAPVTEGDLGQRGAVVAVAFDGRDYAVVTRSLISLGAGVQAAWVDPATGALDGATVRATTSTLGPFGAASDGHGRTAIVYPWAPTLSYFTLGSIRARFAARLAPQGAACIAAGDCASGFCVDGVCCDAACGGGDPGDCVACSAAAGAPVDGHCAVLAAAHVCRAASGPCDAPEACDGVARACADDAFVAAGVGCGPAPSACFDAPRCSGTSPACPPAAADASRCADAGAEAGGPDAGSSADARADDVADAADARDTRMSPDADAAAPDADAATPSFRATGGCACTTRGATRPRVPCALGALVVALALRIRPGRAHRRLRTRRAR